MTLAPGARIRIYRGFTKTGIRHSTERGMIQEDLKSVRVITVANEKGGSGKSTVAIHLAVALLRAGQRVATIDLDARQRTFTRYVENRLEWSRQCGKDLP